MEQKDFVEKYMALEQQMADLKKSYIESNSPWPVGTKVVVHHRQYGDEYGIVKGYEINNATDEVRPILAKIKKDGTAHPTASVYVRCNADVELCND